MSNANPETADIPQLIPLGSLLRDDKPPEWPVTDKEAAAWNEEAWDWVAVREIRPINGGSSISIDVNFQLFQFPTPVWRSIYEALKKRYEGK